MGRWLLDLDLHGLRANQSEWHEASQDQRETQILSSNLHSLESMELWFEPYGGSGTSLMILLNLIMLSLEKFSELCRQLACYTAHPLSGG